MAEIYHELQMSYQRVIVNPQPITLQVHEDYEIFFCSRAEAVSPLSKRFIT